MKHAKKMIAFILVITITLIQGISANASNINLNDDSANLLYKNHHSEEILIDGKTYIYNLYLTDEGNRGMDILDESGQIIAQLEYDEDNYTTLVDGHVWSVGTPDKNVNVLADANWIYFSSVDHTITWPEAAAVAVIAGAIAIGIGFIGPQAVIGAIGFGALSVIAGMSPGGRVDATIYKFNSSLINQYKVIWMFCDPLGVWYGPYTNMVNQ